MRGPGKFRVIEARRETEHDIIVARELSEIQAKLAVATAKKTVIAIEAANDASLRSETIKYGLHKPPGLLEIE